MAILTHEISNDITYSVRPLYLKSKWKALVWLLYTFALVVAIYFTVTSLPDLIAAFQRANPVPSTHEPAEVPIYVIFIAPILFLIAGIAVFILLRYRFDPFGLSEYTKDEIDSETWN
jgi:hypothetical protein